MQKNWSACLGKTFLWLMLFLSVSINPSDSYAQFWNPFAPKTYEECLLKNVKEGMGDAAVRAVAVACRNQYPLRSELKPRDDRGVDARWDACDIQRPPDGARVFFPIDSIAGQMSDLTERNWDSKTRTISFQNKNSFGISGLRIGFTNSKSCSENIQDYRFTIWCGDRYSSVAARSYGTLSCGPVPDAAKKMGYCFLGLTPAVRETPEFWIDFYEQNGLCKK